MTGAAGSASKLEARIEELTTEVAASKERIAALTRSSTEAQTKVGPSFYGARPRVTSTPAARKTHPALPFNHHTRVRRAQADTASKRAAEAEAQIEDMHKQHEEERQQIIDILKTKYTKRIEKWKARVRVAQ